MKLRHIIPLSLLFLLVISSCKKEDLLDSGAKLGFSTDTLSFDTVFHFAGSTTKKFIVYNNNNEAINISKIYLAMGNQSAFKINVDGISTSASNPIIRDIEILPKDSLFIFVQVYVNPSGNSPMLIKDSIIFESNENEQNLKLQAIGQDVYLHKPAPGKFYSILGRSRHDTILPNDKPHLVFGYAVVDSACKLTIKGGTKFYMSNNAVLWVYKAGSLVISGSKGNEVIFQGARLESAYNDVPGQWGKIWLSALSKDNEIDWAIIKNGSIGIHADTVASNVSPTLHITNTIIKNMSSAALFGQGAHINGENCVFANCGEYVAALTIGGKYHFEHCTFANYWNNSKRTTPAILLKNYYITGNLYVIRDLESAYFGNSIIYGNTAEEIGMDSSAHGGTFSYKFENCLLKTSRNTSNSSYYLNSHSNLDPGFTNFEENNYKPLSSSINIIDKGTSAITISTDLNGAARPNGPKPDIGAYEFH